MRSAVRCRKLVRGASTWSKLGFGASRCSIGVEENEASLRKAVLGGISLVDTSPMYGNAFGKSEQMVGKVLGKLQTQAHPTVMTKVGYSAANGDKIPAGAIEMAPGVVHCLEPDFSLQSFRESCARLGPVVPDYILVQNPETQASHALARLLEGKDSEAKEVDPAAVTEAWESTYSKLSLLFAALEELVASGDLLCGYGVSSLGLSEPDSSPMRVCHEQLLKCARNAAGDSHHLGVVQLPGNLLELDGLARAPVMQQAGLKVVVARPLTAVTNSGALSLVGGIFQSDPSQQYMDSCRDALEHFTMPPPEGRRPTPEEEETLKGCQFVQQLVEDLNSQLSQFSSYRHYQENLAHGILPMLNEKFDELDETSVALLESFLSRFGDMVRFHTEGAIRSKLSANYEIPPELPLQDFALHWIQKQPGVDSVLVGLPRQSHAQEALKLVEK